MHKSSELRQIGGGPHSKYLFNILGEGALATDGVKKKRSGVWGGGARPVPPLRIHLYRTNNLLLMIRKSFYMATPRAQQRLILLR